MITLGHNTLDNVYSIKYQSINTIGHTLSRHMDSQCKQPEDVAVAAVPMELEGAGIHNQITSGYFRNGT